ncbi:hypothetical protein GPECTOR_33g631 [Gonium pectorale]|uniref:Uncharacterized protein n=1 Tax=Gonium pectorale TaxID=33097 RepID=A0A150GD39_GONPE|nr:hypothetical protein GPECTOR_33g631 [Gonium pectorale]|eukprot:KXZ47749.1 hypothetical protein GPECTOR_33g631 [Gonium pectorale]
MFCINVLVNSEAVWPGVRTIDRSYGPMVTPAGWAYYIRDLVLFLWGLAVAAQNLVEHKGWKDGMLGAVGHSWQILWYADSIWLVLHVSGNPTGLALAPLFSLSALLASVGTQLRLAVESRELQRQLQADGHEGAPPLAYLLFVAPTSLASGWLLLLHCHAVTVALQVLTGSQQAAATAGCICLVLCSCMALPLLLRFRDVLFGLGFTFSVGSVWVSGFSADDDYRPDQLVAFFCALVIGLLTYCIAAGPQPQPAPVMGGGAGGASGLH